MSDFTELFHPLISDWITLKHLCHMHLLVKYQNTFTGTHMLVEHCYLDKPKTIEYCYKNENALVDALTYSTLGLEPY